jgi:hypothetical protein
MKFSGVVGFWVNDVEVEPSVFKSKIEEKPYVGDLLKDTRRWSDQSSRVNSTLQLSNRIRIVADMYMNRNWDNIKYVKYRGLDTPFTVTSVDLDYPSITLTIGGRYDGEDSSRSGC